jgi:hypothetical protein
MKNGRNILKSTMISKIKLQVKIFDKNYLIKSFSSNITTFIVWDMHHYRVLLAMYISNFLQYMDEYDSFHKGPIDMVY